MVLVDCCHTYSTTTLNVTSAMNSTLTCNCTCSSCIQTTYTTYNNNYDDFYVDEEIVEVPKKDWPEFVRKIKPRILRFDKIQKLMYRRLMFSKSGWLAINGKKKRRGH